MKRSFIFILFTTLSIYLIIGGFNFSQATVGYNDPPNINEISPSNNANVGNEFALQWKFDQNIRIQNPSNYIQNISIKLLVSNKTITIFSNSTPTTLINTIKHLSINLSSYNISLNEGEPIKIIIAIGYAQSTVLAGGGCQNDTEGHTACYSQGFMTIKDVYYYSVQYNYSFSTAFDDITLIITIIVIVGVIIITASLFKRSSKNRIVSACRYQPVYNQFGQIIYIDPYTGRQASTQECQNYFNEERDKQVKQIQKQQYGYY